MYYSNIIEEDAANGIGFRTTLFVSGCNFHCKNCFNQKAQNFNYGKEYTVQTEKYILKQIGKSYIKGLSLLGGDPLWQTNEDIKQLIKLCKIVHSLDKNVWLWSGFTWEDIFGKIPANVVDASIINAQQELITECDVFVDGPFVEELKDLSLAWRGSSNQRVIDVQKSIKENKVVLYCD